MKKVISILVVLVLVVNLLGFYVFNLVFLKQHRAETLRKIEKKEVTHVFQFQAGNFRQNTQSIHWKHSKEFSYKGKMYDIVRYEVNGTQVICYCHQDKKEDKILKGIADAVKMNSDQQTTKSHKKAEYKQFTINEALVNKPEMSMDLYEIAFIKTDRNDNISNPYLPCIAHPPELS